MFRWQTCCLLTCLTWIAIPAIAAPGFQGLGDLPGGIYFSNAIDVSDDGLVVVGQSSGAAPQVGFRWTAASGMQPLPMPTATVTNADGTVIAGKNLRWTSSTGAVVMEGVSNVGRGAESSGMSGDGSVVVGTWDQVNSFRWVAGAGPATEVADFWEAVDVSLDGRAVLGGDLQGNAAIWHSATGVTILEGLPNEEYNYPTALSRDGNVAVGLSYDSNFDSISYRWTAQEGMVPFSSSVAGSDPFYPMDVSGDGSRVVGVDVSGAQAEVILWTTNFGTLNLREWLAANGISIPAGWELFVANAISADGRTIVGKGNNPSGDYEAWIIQLPKPGDANSDGRVDGADYVHWADNFLQTTNLFLNGDFNWDGVVDGADYVEWADHFSPLTSVSVSAVPEPNTAVLLLAGLALIVGHRQIRRTR